MDDQTLADSLNSYASAQSVEALWADHLETMLGFGFHRLLYGFTRQYSKDSYGQTEDLIILSNHCNDYLRRYIGEKLFLHAPMARWARENIGACSWGWAHEMANAGQLTDEEIRVLDFNRSMNVTAGYTISFNSISTRNKGVIALAGEKGVSQDSVDAIWERNGSAVLALNNFFHLQLHTLPQRAGQPLTARQREVLEWVGDGKTVQDIATLLSLTPSTVEKHLRLAREALDVETTAQAVLKATFYNQIHILDPSKVSVR